MMRGKKPILIVLLLIAFLLFMTTTEEEHSSSHSSDFIGKLVNFVILFGGLVFLLHKPIRSMIESRVRGVRNLLEETHQSREDAEKRQAEAEERLAKLEKELQQIITRAREEGAREKERIIQAAEREFARLRSLTQQEVERTYQAGIKELKKHAARLAVEMAKEKIKKKMTEQTHAELIDRSIERIEKVYEKSDSDKEIRSRAH